MRHLWSAVLYTALLFGANAAGAEGPLDAFAVGEMEKMVLSDPQPLTDVAVTDADGATVSLKDKAGKVLLVNLWATWCAPCRLEMPALEALQKAVGGDAFEVVTIATGRNAPEAIDRFFADAGVTALPRLRDPKQEFARAEGVLGLPVTLLVDRQGREIGRLTGGADWSGPEARALIDAVIALP